VKPQGNFTSLLAIVFVRNYAQFIVSIWVAFASFEITQVRILLGLVEV